MKQKILILIIFLRFFSLYANDSYKTKLDNDKLGFEFYRLNKDINFNILFDVNMGDRIWIKYDQNNQFVRVFNGIRVHDVYCALFDSLADIQEQKDCYQNRLLPEAKQMLMTYYNSIINSVDTFYVYKNFVNSFYDEYYKIQMPVFSPCKNALIYTNPSHGRHIQFLLDVKSKKNFFYGLIVYYFPDEIILTNEYWANKISSMKRIAPHWYYKEDVPMHDGYPPR